MRQISLTAAAAQLPSLIESAAQESVVLTAESGGPVAVLVSFQEFEALQIARSLVKDPGRLAEIRKAHHQALAGDFDAFEDLATVLEDADS